MKFQFLNVWKKNWKSGDDGSTCICTTGSCGPNEEYRKGDACDRTCCSIRLHKPCGIVNIKEAEGCYCVAGYARDVKGVCILETSLDCKFIKNCPNKNNESPPTSRKPVYCGANEECLCNGNACDQTCASYHLGTHCCVYFIQAPSGCYCKPGYARVSINGNSNGNCVPVDSDECLDVLCNRVTATQPKV